MFRHIMDSHEIWFDSMNVQAYHGFTWNLIWFNVQAYHVFPWNLIKWMFRYIMSFHEIWYDSMNVQAYHVFEWNLMFRHIMDNVTTALGQWTIRVALLLHSSSNLSQLDPGFFFLALSEALVSRISLGILYDSSRIFSRISLRFVTFETLITALTIENLKSW